MPTSSASVSDVNAEAIWLSLEVVTPNPSLVGDDGVSGYAPLAVVTGGAFYCFIATISGCRQSLPTAQTLR